MAGVFDREFTTRLTALDDVSARTAGKPIAELVHQMVRALHLRNQQNLPLWRTLVARRCA